MSIRTVGFDLKIVNERGTTVSALSYAHYCQEILGYNVKLFYERGRSLTRSVEEARRRFELIGYDAEDDFRTVTAPHKLDVSYSLKAGWDDHRRAVAERNVVHVVFKRYHPHGDVYAAISGWLSDCLTGGRMPFVPHIVVRQPVTADLRAELGIPRDAFVVGRHGGYDEFNIPFVHSAVIEALSRRKNLFFVFFNTRPFCEHERVFFLGHLDHEKRPNFLAACDVGLSARMMGESFGLANAEFLASGRPVFAWAGGSDRNHTVMVPRREWLYKRRSDLMELLLNYEPCGRDREVAENSVVEFKPEAVIKKFDDVFVRGPVGGFYRPSPRLRLQRLVGHNVNKIKFGLWLKT